MRYILLALLLLIPASAEAYIGPGLGLGTIGVVLGMLMSMVLALFAVIWYPFKRLIKRFKKRKSAPAPEGVSARP